MSNAEVGYNARMLTPPRRWFAFRLRTLMLCIVPLCAVLCWWISGQFKWINARHRAMQLTTVELSPDVKAPWQLRLFGEQGARSYRFSTDDGAAITGEELEALFPEAQFWVGRGHGWNRVPIPRLPPAARPKPVP